MMIPGKALGLGLLAASVAAGPGSAETMIFATDLSPTHVVSIHGSDALMSCITSRTNGAIDFNYFPSGQLIKRDEGISSLKANLVQFAFITVPLETATIPMQSVTMLPGLSSSAHESVVAWRKALDTNGVMSKEFETAGIKPIIVSVLAPYQIMSREPFDTVAKWEGKKIRTTGSALNFLAASLGGVPVEMPATDLYTAIQTGTVDATVLSFSSVKPYSLQEIVKSMSANGSFGTSSQVFGMSLDYFNKLPADQQKAIDQCGRETESAMSAFIDSTEGELKKEFAAAGVDVFEFTPEALAEFDAKMSSTSDDFLARLNERGLPAQQALDEYKAALGK